MPMYEYECAKCGGVFEKLEKFSDEPLKKHAGCGGKVRRLISAPGFQFKGSGWYVTDYGKGNSGGTSPAGDSESSSASDSGSSSGSSDSTDSSSSSESSSKTAGKSSGDSSAKASKTEKKSSGK